MFLDNMEVVNILDNHAHTAKIISLQGIHVECDPNYVADKPSISAS